MSPHEIDEILGRYLRNECTDKERQLVEEWFDAIGKNDRQLDTVTQMAVQKKLWSKINTAEHRQVIYWRITRVAAALLILIVSSYLLINYFHSKENPLQAPDAPVRMTQIKNPSATEKRIEMKDGSVILLQPGSEVRIPEVFRDKREVYLSGEAFFEVTKNVNQPFLVYANEVTTRVLGTSFLIRAYKEDKEITVAVKTGRVSVSTATSRDKQKTQGEIIMTPNQQVIYNRNENLAVKMLVDDPQIIAQQAATKASFKNAPVVEILESLEKSYGIDIQYDADALAACTLTYADITEEGLYDQIEIICNALGGRYERSEFSILIEAEGCR